MRQLLGEIRRRLRPAPVRPAILMYHRIAAPRFDPWGLAVSPENFEAHLRVVRTRRAPMTMSDFVRQLERGTLPRNAIAVTFDDGYADNLHRAKPMLSAAGVPATLFVMSGGIGRIAGFWWDEVARGILARAKAIDFEVVIAGERCGITLDEADEKSVVRSHWRAWQDPETPRERAYLDVWSRLRVVRPDERERALAILRAALNTPPPDEDDRPMNAQELVQMASDAAIEIGGHTVSHPVLPRLEPEERRREILDGKQACERMVSAPMAGFAYPHGASDEETRAAVRDCGFDWACTTEHRCVRAGVDVYALPRLFVEDWNGPAFDRALAEASARSARDERLASAGTNATR